MAFYSYRILVEPGIPEDNPLVVDLPLKERWISQIWVGFEDGCGWAVKVRINYGIRRFYPENPNGWIVGNDIYIPIPGIIKLPAKWESIKALICSPTAKYDHEVYILVWTSDEEIEPVEVSLVKLVKGLGI